MGNLQDLHWYCTEYLYLCLVRVMADDLSITSLRSLQARSRSISNTSSRHACIKRPKRNVKDLWYPHNATVCRRLCRGTCSISFGGACTPQRAKYITSIDLNCQCGIAIRPGKVFLGRRYEVLGTTIECMYRTVCKYTYLLKYGNVSTPRFAIFINSFIRSHCP